MSEYRNWSNDVNVSDQQEEATFSLVKVFGYMFAGLLITTIVMLGLGGLFRHLFGIGDAFADDCLIRGSYYNVLCRSYGFTSWCP